MALCCALLLGSCVERDLDHRPDAGDPVYRIAIPSDFFTAYPAIATFNGTRTYLVYDPQDDQADLSLKRRIAEIDLEYIEGFSDETPAVVVYAMDYSTDPLGVRAATGVIANDGRGVDWSVADLSALALDDYAGGRYTGLYDASSLPLAAAFTAFYYDPLSGISFTDPGVPTLALDPDPYVFTDWGRLRVPGGQDRIAVLDRRQPEGKDIQRRDGHTDERA